MTAPVLVVGASGNLGGAAARSLLAAGITVRVCGTNPDRLRARFPDAEACRLDLRDPGTFEPALHGVNGLFLVRPPAISRVGPTVNAFVDAAARLQAGHVVFASVTGADTNRVVPHHRIETHLQASRLPWTILRPGFFAQNLTDSYRADIRDDNRIFLPAADGKVAFIDTRDLGDVSATIFRDPAAHCGTGYTLTGAEALDFYQVAELLTEALGRPVRYQPASVVGYLRHLRRSRTPLPLMLVQTVLHVGLRHGQAQTVDPSLARLLGRRPRTLAQYVHDHRQLWTPR